MNPSRILVIEDDDDIRTLVRTVLERAGMTVIEAKDGPTGLRRFYDGRPQLVVLDLAMPEVSGWQVLERIRELSDVPVLILTASITELEKVRALTAGADDYLTKPFGHQELAARVDALLRRGGEGHAVSEVHEDEMIEIDFAKRRVTVRGQEVKLTPTEFKLLFALASHRGQVLSKAQLVELVWGSSGGRDHSQVKLYVSYLRRKLREAADVNPIETVRGFGYRYSPGD